MAHPNLFALGNELKTVAVTLILLLAASQDHCLHVPDTGANSRIRRRVSA